MTMCLGTNMDSQIKTIEDLVFNDSKIVTHKLLSNVLNVHINKSKELLNTFVEKVHNENLIVTYIISGFSLRDSGLNVILVKEKDLNQVKGSFRQVVSQHIYSIQKGESLTSLHDIYAAIVDTERPSIEHCAIHINGNIEREGVESNSHAPSTVSAAKKPELNKEAVKLPNEKIVEVAQKADFVDSSLNKNKEASKNTESIKENVNGNVKSKSVSPSKVEKRAIKKKNTSLPKGGGIGAFFNRQLLNNEKKKNEELEKKSSSNGTDPTKNKTSISGSASNLKEPEKVNDVKDKSGKNNTKEKQTRKGRVETYKRKKSKDDNDNAKKRKRIFVASESSESSDEEVMEMDEEPPEPPPPIVATPESDEEVIPPTPTVKGRKRVRKHIDKTYTDEDGFIITKKEYVFESCSDNEEASPKVTTTNDKSPVKISEKTNSVNKKANSPNKNKQSSIKNFFKIK